jgi:threo-3-hydroxy-L-aspartate ammonia-lyase
LADLVSRDDILEAAAALDGVAIRTPLLPAPWLDDETGGEVRLKCENLQRAGAFKIRGAYTMISRLPVELRERGVIAYSSGNHAQGVALAAKLFGVRCVVVMPTTAPSIKVEGARSLGAEVILEGTTSTERQKRAEAEAAAQGLVIVPAFDHPDIIAGQGTAGLEILQDWPEVETVLVPIGGGGLASGVAAWIKGTNPAIRVIGVEPEGADAMRQSREAGHPVTIQLEPTIADGLMPVRPGDLTCAHACELLDDIVVVNDDEIRDATRELLRRSKLIVEFSGAATVAALRSGRTPRGRVAVILSGGNLDPVRAMAMMSESREPVAT